MCVLHPPFFRCFFTLILILTLSLTLAAAAAPPPTACGDEIDAEFGLPYLTFTLINSPPKLVLNIDNRVCIGSTVRHSFHEFPRHLAAGNV